MDTVMNTIISRRSIRSYKPDPVPQELIDRIIEAGLYAASGMGRQDTIIIGVTDRRVRDSLSQINASVMGREGTDPFYGAPAVLVVLARRDVSTHIYDGALTLGNMMLEAHELGLGSCWIHRAREEFETDEGRKLLRSLGITDDLEGIGHLIVGYPDGDYPKEAPARKAGRVYYVK